MRTARGSRRDLARIYRAAVEAASPAAAVRSGLRLRRSGQRARLEAGGLSLDLGAFRNVFILGAGKAVCPMASAVEELLKGRVSGGVVVTKHGHATSLGRVEVIEAGHPVPDLCGMAGAARIMEAAQAAGKDDLVIFLLTGGASALLPAPAEGITLSQKQRATKLLLNSGATINEINAVRKHLSAIKGGRLAALAWPARVLTLIVSDVVGSDLATIGSGPTTPDPTTFFEALGVLRRYGLSSKVPAAVLGRLRKGAAGRLDETPKPGHRAFRRCESLVLADNLSALAAARDKARDLGYHPVILTSTATGPTREAARLFVSILREALASSNPARPPACLLMGGETTLRVTGRGRGGRNQEFALASAIELNGHKGISMLAAGTDGTDGPTDAAGALVLPDTLKRAASLGLDPAALLAENDSYGFFGRIGGLFKTGPTGTNVMDIAIGLAVEP